MAEHGLPFIPIYSTLIEGDRELFPDDAGRQNQPFLFTLSQSGMADRQNLALTVWFTNLFAMGANTSYLAEMQNRDEDVVIDNSVIGGVTKIQRGDKLGPMPRELVPRELVQALELLDGKVSESTMFRQALGQPVGGSNTFSTVALLSQSGRLPLVRTKERLGLALAGAMRMSLLWLRELGGKGRAKFGMLEGELSAKDIPDDIEVGCSIEVALPQDKLQNANIYNNLVDSGGVSRRWGRENLLQVGQSEDMEREIWTERAAERMYQLFVEEVLPGMMSQGGAGFGNEMVPPGMAGPGGAMGPEGMGSPMDGGVPAVMGEGPAAPGELPGEVRGMGPGGEGEVPPGMV